MSSVFYDLLGSASMWGEGALLGRDDLENLGAFFFQNGATHAISLGRRERKRVKRPFQNLAKHKATGVKSSLRF